MAAFLFKITLTFLVFSLVSSFLSTPIYGNYKSNRGKKVSHFFDKMSDVFFFLTASLGASWVITLIWTLGGSA